MKSIINEDIPCWYDLSWNVEPEKEGILLKIHEDFIVNFGQKLSKNSPIVVDFLERFGFSKFETDFDKDIGFDGVLLNRGCDDGFRKYLAVLPNCQKTNEKCRWCNGSGIDTISGEECFSCDGTGKGYYFDWYIADAISASFSIYFLLLNVGEEIKTSASFFQLMLLRSSTIREMSGFGLGGDVSFALCRWLKLFPDSTEFPEIEAAMRLAYRKMARKLSAINMHKFSAYIHENGGIIINCPGDACGLHPESWYSVKNKDEGYRIVSHNVDNALQQLTLLAGIAALHDLARKEIYKGA